MGRAVVATLVLLVLLVPGVAQSAGPTNVSGTISANTTWTLANSPYVMVGNVTVASGVTLTVEPGVVVKLNAASRTLIVNGTLSAVGTAASHIVFTSIQDDTVGGDSNGDGGATTGAPGQWLDITFNAGTPSLLKYVDVRFGGWGSGWTYGQLRTGTSGASFTVESSTVTKAQRTGVYASSGTAATVKSSTISENETGIGANDGTVTVEQSTVSSNTAEGVRFNLTLSYTGAGSSITSSDVKQNGADGVEVYVDRNLALGKWPRGNRNNIFDNTAKQLFLGGYHPSGTPQYAVDWSGNYWGQVEYGRNPGACAATAPTILGHVGPPPPGASAPAGPISSGTYLASEGGTPYWCGYDRFKLGWAEFERTYIDNGARLAAGALLGACDGNAHLKGVLNVCQSDPVNSALGNFSHQVTDLSLPGAGVSFALTRSYSALDTNTGPFGRGWTHNHLAALTIKANGDVTFRAEDGALLEYLKQPDGSFTTPAGVLSTLASVAGGYELVTQDQVKSTFNAQGRLSSVKDRNNQGLTYAYDGSNRPATVTDAAGRQATLTYNASSLLTQVAMQDGRTVGYAYTNGRLTSATDVNSQTWTYTYEGHGLLEKEIDPLQHTVFRNVYSDYGRVIEQYDALNNKTSFTWDAATQTTTATDARNNTWKDVYVNNVLQKRIDALAKETQFGHNAALDGTSVTGPDAQTTTMTYDARGNLLSAVAPASLGATKTFAYNTRNDVTSVTDARGKVTTYGYDAAGNKTSIVQDGQTAATYAYNASGQLTSTTDGRGNTTTYTYDANGNLASETDALGNKTTYAYDSAGRVISKVEPRGNVTGANPDDYKTTYTYDAGGRLLTETNPLGGVTSYTYDAAGNRTSVKDANNKTSSYAYDNADRLLTETAPDGGVTTYTYDVVGNKLTERNALNQTTTYTYDADNRLASVTTPLGNKTTYSYDGNGNQTKVVEPRGNISGANPDEYATTFTYDAAGRVLTETDSLGNTTTYTYDAVGNRTSARDARNNTTSYAFDGRNRLTSVTAPGSAATTYTYDGNSNLLTRTDARGNVTTYVYDTANRLTSETRPLSRQWTYAYDAAGNRTAMTDANGNSTQTAGDGTTTYVYDRAGRLSSIDYSDSTPDVTFTYDAVGNRTQMTDGAGTQTYAYDPVNRLTQATRGTDTFAYVYDLAGNLTRRTYPDGTITDYTVDADSRMASVASGGQTSGYAYDAAGNLTQTTLPAVNGHLEQRTYDRAGRLTRVNTFKGATTLADFTYTLDAVGNPTQVVRAGTLPGATTYAYDNRDRLTEVCFQTSCPGGADPFIRWTYDAVGNRLTEARPTGTTSYTYNSADQLTQAGSTTYTYDQNGNETAGGTRTFAYDLADRLASTASGGTTTTYSYDGNGNRAQTTAGSQTTKLAWDTSHPLPQLALERDGAGTLLRRYLYGQKRLSLTSGGSTSYYHYDPLGSVTNLTSSTGSSQWTYGYDPYGAIRTETQDDPGAPQNAMKFAGELLDATGLYYLRARQYDPLQGRFLRLDPFATAPGTPRVSEYVYAGDRPTVFVDPSGMTFVPADAQRAPLSASSPDPGTGARAWLLWGVIRIGLFATSYQPLAQLTIRETPATIAESGVYALNWWLSFTKATNAAAGLITQITGTYVVNGNAVGTPRYYRGPDRVVAPGYAYHSVLPRYRFLGSSRDRSLASGDAVRLDWSFGGTRGGGRVFAKWTMS